MEGGWVEGEERWARLGVRVLGGRVLGVRVVVLITSLIPPAASKTLPMAPLMDGVAELFPRLSI